MDILIIGGTRFVGRHLVEAAQRRGHTVTLFNRGQSNPGLYPDVEQITGDRNSDLGRLSGRTWAAVIDTCGYFPASVRASVKALRRAVKQYVFISSISVYADLSQPDVDESAAVATTETPEAEEITNENYGPLKALCEHSVREHYPEAHLIIRPGLIVGRYDPTDRFTYWLWRVAIGGEVLAPEGPGWDVQIIDAADLADWIIKLVEQKTGGIFNAVGPEQPYEFGTILDVSRNLSHSDADWTWVSREFLLSQKVQPWSDLPLWMGEETDGGVMRVDNHAALQSGLSFRPLTQTVRDTLAWVHDRLQDPALKAGISRSREKELLKAWHTRKQNDKG